MVVTKERKLRKSRTSLRGGGGATSSFVLGYGLGIKLQPADRGRVYVQC